MLKSSFLKNISKYKTLRNINGSLILYNIPKMNLVSNSKVSMSKSHF